MMYVTLSLAGSPVDLPTFTSTLCGPLGRGTPGTTNFKVFASGNVAILDSGSRSAGTIKANVISWSFSKRLKENRELISGCTLTVMENSKGWVVTSLGSIWTSKGSSALLPANGIARVNRSEKPVTNNLYIEILPFICVYLLP